MPSLRQIRRRISSVKGTQRIMSAMKLISAVKLQRVQGNLFAYRPYSDAFKEIAENLAIKCDPEAHPLLRRPEERNKLHVVLMTSDRGLSGSFNSNLIRKIETFLVGDGKAYGGLSFRFIGRKGRDYFSKRNVGAGESYVGVNERNFGEVSGKIASDLAREFIRGEADEIVLVYSYFKSAISQVVTFERLLPIEPQNRDRGGEPQSVDYLYEPTRAGVLKYVLPKYIQARVERAILETVTSEHAARMAAMESATRNASEVVRRLTLLFNKTRQATITKELMDIVNGTEALRKGGMD